MADERIAWYSQKNRKDTISDTDILMVYDGSKTYMIPFAAIKNAIPTGGGSEPDPGTGSTPDPGTGSTNNWYDAVQKLSVNDADLFPVYDGTDAYVVPISAIRGADNLTDNEVILVGEDGNDYRIKVDVLGKAKVIKDSAYTATLPNESDNTNKVYQALIINQMWGGGDLLTGTSCSHSFIELYNLSNAELNLRGLYIWYKSGTSAWESQ